MRKSLDNFYKKQSLFYKYLLYFISIALIVFFFPRGGKFKYDFQKGKPWQYENLYAPFDFSIKKTNEEIENEQQQLKDNSIAYYAYDAEGYQNSVRSYQNNFKNSFLSNEIPSAKRKQLFDLGKRVIDSIYSNGVFNKPIADNEVLLVINNEAK